MMRIPLFICFIWICHAMLSFPSLSENSDGIADRFGATRGSQKYQQEYDRNRDGIIDGVDLALISSECFDFNGKSRRIQHPVDYILVRFKPQISGATADTLLARLKSKSISKRSAQNAYSRVVVPEGIALLEFVQIMKSLEEVIDAQPDFFCYKTDIPDDPFLGLQWNFDQVRVPYAWDMTFGGDSSVTIAVLDTGLAYENYQGYALAPDLEGTAVKPGYDFINNDDHPNDDEGHGTHVTGTIAQTTDNGLGVAGIAYRCTILPVKVLGSDGSGTAMGLSEGITYAVDHGADVINMSLGFSVGVDPGAVVANAMLYAYENGVICVASSGNEADSPGYRGGISYPAAYSQCVAVGAVRFDRHRAYYSSFGDGLTCVAPGGDLRVDQNRDQYDDGIVQQTFINHRYTQFQFYFFQGTSMAAPHVSAAAALFKSRFGKGPDEFSEAIRETSTDLGAPGYDAEYGWGLIDIPRLIKKAKGWGANQ